MDKFLELIAKDIEFGAIEILKDTCETRREEQLVLPTARQKNIKSSCVLLRTAKKYYHKLKIYVISLTLQKTFL